MSTKGSSRTDLRPEARNQEDVELMARVAAGHEDARRAVAERFVGRARRVARALLHNAVDADDASQVGLMEMLRSAGTYAGISSLERWVDRIVVRSALRIARQRRRRQEVVDSETAVDEVPGEERAGDAPSELEAHLSQLSEANRTAIVLRHLMEYSIEETAEAMGVSPNTVKDRLVRGREQLRKLWRREAVVQSAALAKPTRAPS
jgi:RNA polymerase sigma-70 factor (ECF subfamily)